MKRCAEVWRQRVLEQLPQDSTLVLLVGGYAQRWHLGRRVGKDTDRDCRELEVCTHVTACSPCRTQAGGIPHG
jgi:uracil-DNA glycosylase